MPDMPMPDMPMPDTPDAITLLHAPDGVGYRLLELPDELVDSQDKWSISSKDGLARLTAGGRTYAMRQKNTSNALVLLQSGAPESAVSAEAEAESTPSLTAVATVHETVELVEEKAAPAAAAPKPKNKWHEKFGRAR